MVLTIGDKTYTKVIGPDEINVYHSKLIVIHYPTNKTPRTPIFDDLKCPQFTCKVNMLSTKQIIKYYKHFYELLSKDKQKNHMLEEYHRDRLMYQECNLPGSYYGNESLISTIEREYLNLVNIFQSVMKHTPEKEHPMCLTTFLQQLNTHPTYSTCLKWYHNWYLEKWICIKIVKNCKLALEPSKYVVVHCYLNRIYFVTIPRQLGYINMVSMHSPLCLESEEESYVNADGVILPF